MGGCLPCLRSSNIQANVATHSGLRFTSAVSSPNSRNIIEPIIIDQNDTPIIPHSQAKTFTFRELATATNNFRPECRIGEGGFGRVYKGSLESTGEIIAVKMLNIDGIQGNEEFLVEITMLSNLHHENLVNLIGYCADGDQRIVVYEFMPLGSLYDHLHHLKGGQKPLDWNTRLKIVTGAAKGLEYLHNEANPPVIVRDFKTANILLNEGYEPKISDFGLAKFGPTGDKTHVTTRVMGTFGYCAPDYAMTGQLTVKSDVYSFGVVLLEIITGRFAIDDTLNEEERHLVEWAKPLFRDKRKFPKMVDPMLEGRYPTKGLYQVLLIAAMCLQDDAASRPSMGDVVTSLMYVTSQTFDPNDAKANSGRELLVASSELKNIDWQDLRKQFRERWVTRSETDEAGPSRQEGEKSS